ncbi:bifunctional 3,4-dihydroxy-2-butanone-4-phosphate synthase/GTP cyclohydrolase II [Amycolatopsis sp. TRM77291]
MSTRHSPAEAVQHALAALAEGRMIVVADGADREDEGDLIVAAEFVTAEQMAFLVRHGTGIVCTPMPAERADDLRLPPMVTDNTDAHGTAFTVSVDHMSTGTGVSAADRATTSRSLASHRTQPGELRRPGHVFPLRARKGGVLVRPGHTEAAVDLTMMAGLSGVGVITEITADDGTMPSGASLAAFARQHDLPYLTIADLVHHRRATERTVEQFATSSMPTAFGTFRAVAYRSTIDSREHLALVMGDVSEAGRAERGALVRVHSECLTGDTFGSLRCDCGSQFKQAMQAIAEEGCGALIYLRGHEGRGIGLAHKIRAYALQDEGLDTVDANVVQGLPADSRSYGVGSQILRDLAISRLRLITNNPAKFGGLASYGLTIVDRVALPIVETPHNVRYLRTKHERMGHQIEMRSAES